MHPPPPFALLAALLVLTGNLGASVTLVRSGSIIIDQVYATAPPAPSDAHLQFIDADGYDVTQINRSAISHSERTTNTTYGGGTAISDSKYSVYTETRERETSDSDSYSYDASYRFDSTLEFRHQVSTYGNFAFITVADSVTTVDLSRTLEFIVDRPLEILMRFDSTAVDPVLPNFSMFSNAVNFLNLHFAFSSGRPPTNSGGEKNGIRHSLSYSSGAGFMDLQLILEPVDPAAPVPVILRWLSKREYEDTLLLAISGTRSVATSGFYQESINIRPVPEPSSILIILITTPAFLHRRRSKMPARHPVSER